MNAKDSFTRVTVETARRAMAARFRSAGLESAELDARLLAGSALFLDLTGLIVSAARALTPAEAARLEEFAERRLDGEPVARIIGTKEFWGLPLKLSPETLVPRPDTETVVELALEMIRAQPPSGPALRILDIGTGTGAILFALLHELRRGFGIGTDISLPALQIAKSNAVMLNFAPRAAFVACDHAAALSGAFDLIVSNPPYIRSADIASLAREVRDHDPRAALDGGADGLDAYRALIPQAARLLGSGGALVVEAGKGQSGQIKALMTAAGLTAERPPRLDLAGIARAVGARKIP